MLIDTHCHLDAAEFDPDRDRAVAAARAAGVEIQIVPAVEKDNFAAVLECCRRYPGCYPALGIHPMYVDRAQPADIVALRTAVKQESLVAIGEIGLDFFVPDYDREMQEFYFVEQLKVARDSDLPVLLHIRRAQDQVLKHLRRIHVCGGIAHAFNGSRQQADEFIKLGFRLGFGGAMTYPRATRLRELAATLPLEAIVLETDAPDMAPVWIGKGRNSSENLPRIAQTLAELRGITFEELARVTSANARAVVKGLA
ncbi:MAG: TatD family hydrolase [Pseudomonadota bacterium]